MSISEFACMGACWLLILATGVSLLTGIIWPLIAACGIAAVVMLIAHESNETAP